VELVWVKAFSALGKQKFDNFNVQVHSLFLLTASAPILTSHRSFYRSVAIYGPLTLYRIVPATFGFLYNFYRLFRLHPTSSGIPTCTYPQPNPNSLLSAALVCIITAYQCLCFTTDLLCHWPTAPLYPLSSFLSTAGNALALESYDVVGVGSYSEAGGVGLWSRRQGVRVGRCRLRLYPPLWLNECNSL
jgi:hypothetical protein